MEDSILNPITDIQKIDGKTQSGKRGEGVTIVPIPKKSKKSDAGN
jgi:hypothetical protein